MILEVVGFAHMFLLLPYRPLGYERVHLPLYIVRDTHFRIQSRARYKFQRSPGLTGTSFSFIVLKQTIIELEISGELKCGNNPYNYLEPCSLISINRYC